MPTLAISIGVTVMPVGWAGAVGVIIALLSGFAVLLSGRRAIRQTTLVAAWWWTLLALIAWSGVELAAALWGEGSGEGLLGPLRWAAMTLSSCPIVAVLGAKRPQQKAWNFVVLSLWAIVALPAAENFFLHRGQKLEMGDARGWFLWILILLGPINFIPTRHWLVSLVLAAGQVGAFSSHLALLRRPMVPQPELVGLLLAGAALVVAWLSSRRATVAANSYDRLWIDFRDTFGLLWGLRVQERVNAAARQNGWDLELTWSGFRQRVSDDPLAEIDPAIESVLRTTFRGLLRRFVSSEWIAERLCR
ncbi:MAG TPA: hypothetical protein VKH44_04010, partial [Pirellulaceae bacterium]|nr:hypothetical protein [Pirellulaceae bacterium]